MVEMCLWAYNKVVKNALQATDITHIHFVPVEQRLPQVMQIGWAPDGSFPVVYSHIGNIFKV
jgi:hypothetical protein